MSWLSDIFKRKTDTAEQNGKGPCLDTAEIRAAIGAASSNVVTLPPPTVEDTQPRYRVDVVENMAIAGFGTTKGMRYRWTVVRLCDGRIIKTGYSFTINMCYTVADSWASKQQRKGKL